MYNEYFGLKESPFSISPDPRFLFMSEGHQEALAHLVYGISSDSGFVLLTGEVGTGKTTVCRSLLKQVPEESDIAFILNPKVTAAELLASICEELGIKYPEGNTSIRIFVDRINAYLLEAYARGRRTVLIIEEAQNLAPDVLEQVRLLTNLETDKRKLLQIIMLGQPELGDMLSRPELRQLSQRITARYHLGPLSKKDLAAYVAHRLTIAGGKVNLFPAPVVSRIFSLSKGVPRLINVLCDRALLGAYVQGKEYVDIRTINSAAAEVFGASKPGIQMRTGKRYRSLTTGMFFIVVGFLAAIAYFYNRHLHIPDNTPLTQSPDTAPRTTADKTMPWLISPRYQRQSIRAATWIETKSPEGQMPPFQERTAHATKRRTAEDTISPETKSTPHFAAHPDTLEGDTGTITDEKKGGD